MSAMWRNGGDGAEHHLVADAWAHHHLAHRRIDEQSAHDVVERGDGGQGDVPGAAVLGVA